jgi:hypothetical protein
VKKFNFEILNFNFEVLMLHLGQNPFWGSDFNFRGSEPFFESMVWGQGPFSEAFFFFGVRTLFSKAWFGVGTFFSEVFFLEVRTLFRKHFFGGVKSIFWTTGACSKTS